MTFEKRELTGPGTLGQRLRQLREERGWSVEELGQDLQIAPKYITAIEEGHYEVLPGMVYAKNFVRRYVERMELDSAAAMERFETEYQLMHVVRPSGRPLLAQRATTGVVWWSRHLRLLLAIFSILVVLSYFGWQLFRLFSPPSLLVIQPNRDLTTISRTIEVRGQTEPDAVVTINRQDVEVSPTGAFVEQVDLQPGLNSLRIAAAKKRSQERVVIRQVLVENPEDLPSR